MSIDDCVSDTETVMGTRRIVRGRFHQSHVDGWTTKRWYNKVHVEGWLKGLQGVEVVPSCPDISTTAKPKKNLCPSPSLNLKVWMATGLPVDLHPWSYHESEETTLVRYITEVMNSYVDGIPRHISIKVDLPSCVKPISFASWEAMSKAEQSDSLCRFQVLVYDCPYIRGGGFDEDTLGRYVQLDRHTTMTDHSLDPEGPRQVSADMYAVLQEAIPKRRPRVLNAIDYWKVFGETKFWEAVADGDDSIKELENCQWEGVLLPPRSRLFMRSNTVHRVITVDHSIVKGGHFFNRGTLMETFFNNIVVFLAVKY
ncbi:hypothetical protein BKA70DRAFT_1451681 [Coprinopsis sp. MPI-PUGE-AT-0042]|nr:hypothetical protein BKA70DRAFT_1451681 [Coprinopsis sp. MPI-PUGE-AT-0042]